MANPVPDKAEDSNRKPSNLSFLDSWSGCKNCGNKNDLGAYFHPSGVCMNCTRKAHKKAMGR